MKEKIKYLNLFVLLAFLVGQVQYAYSFYFCTMKNTPVSLSRSALMMDESGSQACDECSGFVQPAPGQQIVPADCMVVHNLEKSIVCNFISSQKSIRHSISIVAINFSLSTIGFQLSGMSHVLSATTDSPPLDLPTFNNNLRI